MRCPGACSATCSTYCSSGNLPWTMCGRSQSTSNAITRPARSPIRPGRAAEGGSHVPDISHTEIGDQTLQALLDKEAIRDLVLDYSRGVDRQDFALLRTLYTADAMEPDHGGNFSGTAEAYVDWLEEVM